MALAILWLAPIPVGLFAGWLHLTWGNLSFHPEAKRRLLAWELVLFALLGMAIRFGVRPDDRRPLRQVASAGLTALAILIGVTAFRSGLPNMGWLPGSVVELALLGVAAGALHRSTSSPIGPAVAASVIWMTRTGGMTFADGPFDGVGMIVTSPLGVSIQTVIWPLILTIGLTLLALRR